MTTKLLNHYKGLFDGGAADFCDASTMVAAAELLVKDGIEPTLLQRVGTGIKVLVPDAPLSFKTSVEATAYAAGCRAYPSGGEVVRGQKLFLSAAKGDGYSFAGWYNGADLISAELEAEVTVESDTTLPSVITYEAKFNLD